MWDAIVTLRVREQDQLIDLSRLRELKTTVGATVFEDIFEDAICEITERLARIERLVATGRSAEVVGLAHDLKALAAQIGLARVAEVAAALEAECVRGDPVATPAITARLLRLGEDSLLAAAEFSVDIPGGASSA